MKPICAHCHTPIMGSIAAHGDPGKPNTPLLHPECAPYWRKPEITEAEEFIANLRQQMQTGMDLEAYIAHACFENFIEAKIGDYEVTYHRGVARLYNLLSGDLLDEKS